MIERIYSNVAVFHDSERIITTYKFEDTEHSQVVKSHVAKAVSERRQSRKQAASSKQLPSPPVDSPMADDTATVVSPIALDTPSSLKDDEDMSVLDEAKEAIEEEMSEADILEKLAQLKAEKHRLFQQVKNMMISKESPPTSAESVIMVSNDDDSKPSHVGTPFDLQYSTTQLAGSRPSSPPTSPHNRMSNYPSPSSPSDHGPVNHFKNAFKFAERPFSRTPYERRPYSPNTPPLSPPTAGRRPPVVFGQPYRQRQGYFNRGGMPSRRY